MEVVTQGCSSMDLAMDVCMEDEALLFGKSLFSYLFSSHPLFEECSHLFCKRKDSSIFTTDVGNAVMYISLLNKDFLEMKFRSDFPDIIKDNILLERYLEELLKNAAVDQFKFPFTKVIAYSSILFELIAFLYRRRITEYVYTSPYHWLHMFKLYAGVEFFEKGGWVALAIAARHVLKDDYEKYIQQELTRFWAPTSGATETAQAATI